MKSTFLLTVMIAGATMAAQADEGRLLRFPATNGTDVVFSYAGDLYKAPLSGGEAVRLTSSNGYEMFARFSPDGKQIAFTGQYDGSTEVYLMPADGGEPTRLTYSPTNSRDDLADRMGPNNVVMAWTPDGQGIVYRNRISSGFDGVLMTVSPTGGDARADTAARRWFLLLFARRQQACLQPSVPRVPHMEVLQGRHGRRHLDLRPCGWQGGECDQQCGARHFPDVDWRRDILRQRPRPPHEPVCV